MLELLSVLNCPNVCFIGRSLRLQTSDGDRGKLGRLAELAVYAGFDWVECTNQNYIRASVIPDGKRPLVT